MAQARLSPPSFLSDSQLEQLVSLWKYVHHEMLSICYVVMDAALIMPLALGFMQWARFWPPAQVFLWLGCLMLFAFNYSRFLVKIGVTDDQLPTWTAVALFTTITFSIRTLIYSPEGFFNPSWLGQLFRDLTTSGGVRWPQALSILFLILIAWMRGLRLATRKVDINMIGLRLRLGGLILAPLIVWFGHSRLIWDVSPYLLLFLLAGLTAVSLTRAEEIEQARSGHSAGLNPKWLSLIFIAALSIVIMATLIAALLSGDSLPVIIGWLTPLVLAFQYLLIAAGVTALDVVIPVWLVIERILTAVVLFFAQTLGIARVLSKIIIKLNKLNPPAAQESAGGATDPGPLEFGRFTIDVSYFQQYSNLIGLLLIIAFILIVALTITMSRQTVSFDDQDTDTIDQNAADKAKPNLFNSLLDRIGAFRDWRTAVSIRRIYRQMCAAAEANGFPRLATETPYEYLKTLAQTWPNGQPETQIITRAYVRIRYGELPENKEELQTIIRAWKTLEEIPPNENHIEADS